MSPGQMIGIRTLVVEDDSRVRNFIKAGLQEAGMMVETAESLNEIDSALLSCDCDILVLDRMMKLSDNLYSLPLIKKQYPHLKILILSALGEPDHKVQGLEYGADDYLAKPFHVRELVARIRALVRRTNTVSEGVPDKNRILEVDGLIIDLDAQKVYRNDQLIELSFKEFRLLVILATNPEKLFSRTELLNRVWSQSFDPESNVVDVTIGRLKRKVNMHGGHSVIFAKRGVGYALRGSDEVRD